MNIRKRIPFGRIEHVSSNHKYQKYANMFEVGMVIHLAGLSRAP